MGLIMRIELGFDPDSEKPGVAMFIGGKLEHCKSMRHIEILKFTSELVEKYPDAEITANIENVLGNKCSSFNHSKKMGPAQKYKVSESVGMCKQSQKILTEIMNELGIQCRFWKVSKLWKSASCPQFKSVTKWGKPSNEDSRSAAYFAWLGSTR